MPFSTYKRSSLAPVLMALLLAACANQDKERFEGERISILSFEQTISPDPRVSNAPIVVPPAFRNNAWSNAGGFASHTAYHLALDGLAPLFATDMVKSATRDRRLKAPPVVAAGRVFALGSALDVVATDGETGEKIWTQSLLPEKRNANTGFGGGIAYGQGIDGAGRLFVTTGFGEVAALAADTGEIIWRVQNDVPFSNAPTVRDGRVYVVSRDSRLQALSMADGGFLWEYSAISENATILTANSVAVSDQLVVAGFNSGEVVGLRNVNGTQIWADTLSGRARQITPLSELNAIISKPVIDRDRAFAVSHGGRMVAIDLRTGERIWTADIGSAETPWVMGDYVLVMSLDGRLICLSRAQGRVRWVQNLNGITDSEGNPLATQPPRNRGSLYWLGPVLAGGRILVVSSLGDLWSLAPQDGSLVETISLGEPVSVPPVIANGTLYILTDKGTLLARR